MYGYKQDLLREWINLNKATSLSSAKELKCNLQKKSEHLKVTNIKLERAIDELISKFEVQERTFNGVTYPTIDDCITAKKDFEHLQAILSDAFNEDTIDSLKNAKKRILEECVSEPIVSEAINSIDAKILDKQAIEDVTQHLCDNTIWNDENQLLELKNHLSSTYGRLQVLETYYNQIDKGIISCRCAPLQYDQYSEENASLIKSTMKEISEEFGSDFNYPEKELMNKTLRTYSKVQRDDKYKTALKQEYDAEMLYKARLNYHPVLRIISLCQNLLLPCLGGVSLAMFFGSLLGFIDHGIGTAFLVFVIAGILSICSEVIIYLLSDAELRQASENHQNAIKERKKIEKTRNIDDLDGSCASDCEERELIERIKRKRKSKDRNETVLVIVSTAIALVLMYNNAPNRETSSRDIPSSLSYSDFTVKPSSRNASDNSSNDSSDDSSLFPSVNVMSETATMNKIVDQLVAEASETSDLNDQLEKYSLALRIKFVEFAFKSNIYYYYNGDEDDITYELLMEKLNNEVAEIQDQIIAVSDGETCGNIGADIVSSEFYLFDKTYFEYSIYYDKDRFEPDNIDLDLLWEEFLEHCKTDWHEKSIAQFMRILEEHLNS